MVSSRYTVAPRLGNVLHPFAVADTLCKIVVYRGSREGAERHAASLNRSHELRRAA